MLYFWVIGVTLTTIPNILSNLFSRSFWVLEHRSTSALGTGIQVAPLHPGRTSIFLPHPMSPSALQRTTGWVLPSFTLAWPCWHNRNLPCALSLRSAVIQLLVRAANCTNPTASGFIWSHQYIFAKKPWRTFRFLSPNASSDVTTGKNTFLCEHCINIIFCSSLHLFSAVTTHTSPWLTPMTEGWNSHVPSYKPRQQVIHFHSLLLFSIQHFLSPMPPFYAVFCTPRVLETALCSSSVFYTHRTSCDCPTHRD